MKIAIFNVKYSPNLGDGIIAECLESALSAQPGYGTVSIDIAGRTDFATGLDASRSRLLDILHALPKALRGLAVRVALGTLLRLKLRPRWRRAMRECDAAIVGGGQLIADADLNFPLKLRAVAAECRRRRLPVAVFAVGVAPNWSATGQRMLRRLFSGDVVHVAVRDAHSRASLERLLSGQASGHGQAQLCRDPGLLASEVYPRAPRPVRTRFLVGLGITHPTIIRNHADDPAGLPTCGPDRYAALARALSKAGYDVACFTNGAAEDEACLTAVKDMIEADAAEGEERIRFLDRARRPAELVSHIAGFDLVVAHRLHAHIVASSFGIPSVGLRWDGKVPAFLASMGREEFMATPGQTPIDAILTLVEAALWTGIDEQVRQEALRQTRISIASMAESLRAACHGRPLRHGEVAASVAPPLRAAAAT